MHVEVDLGADREVRTRARAVREAVQREDHGPVRRVLEGHDAVGGAAGLRRLEYVYGRCVLVDVVVMDRWVEK